MEPDQALNDSDLLVSVEIHGDDIERKLATAEHVLEQSGAQPIALPEG